MLHKLRQKNMTLEVLIERDAFGRLHAYVRDRRPDGFVLKGDDLLKKEVFRSVDTARIECERTIRGMFKLLDTPRIEYVLPEETEGL